MTGFNSFWAERMAAKIRAACFSRLVNYNPIEKVPVVKGFAFTYLLLWKIEQGTRFTNQPPPLFRYVL